MKYVALLRGINVGGNRKVPKAELQAGSEGMGFMDVPTVGKMAYIRDTEMNLVGVLQPERGM